MIKKKHNIVVWGGSGFLGSHVSDFLSKEEIRILEKLENIKHRKPNNK